MKKGEKKKQQKALARRKERQAAARKSSRANAPGPSQAKVSAIREARGLPLLGCWAQQGWQDAGITPVVVARRQPGGLVTFACYLVDYYCLGVKDAFTNADIPEGRFMREFLPKMTHGEPAKLSPEVAHELVWGSVEFAARWGFRPHSDFKLAQMVLDPAGQHPPTGQVTFGKDGKPLYVSGPYDHPEAIVRQLARTAGEGNFDYLVGLGPADMFDEDEEDEDYDEDDETAGFDVEQLLRARSQPLQGDSLLDRLKGLIKRD